MDTITKAMAFGGKAIITVIDNTDMANYAIRKHGLSDATGEAMARILCYTSFITAGMKGVSLKASVSIDGNGSFGKIITAGVTGGLVRGTIENKDVEIIPIDGKRDMTRGIGQGTMSVIKDFGLKEPYSGKIELVRGDIDSDFSYYFHVSEQLNTVCISKADVKDGKCTRSGAVLIQPMPNCDDESLFLLEDVACHSFKDITALLNTRTPDEIIDYYFGHFDARVIDTIKPRYVCNCSRERMLSIIASLGEKEARDIISERGNIEIHCDFCNTTYIFNENDIETCFGE